MQTATQKALDQVFTALDALAYVRDDVLPTIRADAEWHAENDFDEYADYVSQHRQTLRDVI